MSVSRVILYKCRVQVVMTYNFFCLGNCKIKPEKYWNNLSKDVVNFMALWYMLFSMQYDAESWNFKTINNPTILLSQVAAIYSKIFWNTTLILTDFIFLHYQIDNHKNDGYEKFVALSKECRILT